MQKSKVWVIAKREYVRTVKRPSFWFIVLALPLLYLVLGFISGYSATSTEKKIEEEARNVQHISVVDHSGLIRNEVLTGPFILLSNDQDAESRVKNNEADAAFIYPTNIVETKKIQVIAKDTGLVTRNRFDTIASQLLNQSILQSIPDEKVRALVGTTFSVDTKLYKDGAEVVGGFEAFLVPIVAVVLYFLMMIVSSSFMLSSVSEEKENRMIETVLSLVSSQQLIIGKIIGLFGVAITQIVTLMLFALVMNSIGSSVFAFHINWANIHLDAFQVVSALFYLFTGFLFMACIMVGVGAAVPTLRDAQQFSAIFIILSILPIYFAYVILADPTGTIAKIVSFTPFTSAMVLVFRSSIGALTPFESVTGILYSRAKPSTCLISVTFFG
jgi:ABC-2 type transport system permease protein